MLNPVPQGPVPLVPENLKKVPQSETGKEQTESIAPVEIEPAISSQSGPSPQDQKSQTATQAQTDAKKKPNVVNKTQKVHKHHPLQSPDKLTTLADLEEENFIEKVEAAHEPNN